MIMSKEELERITYQEIAGKKIEVVADVHGMSKMNAKRFIKNIIAIILDEFFLMIIHGFNHGCAIKDMIRSDILSRRITDLQDVENNKGRTILCISCG